MMRTTASRALLQRLSCAKATAAPGLRFSHIPTTSFAKSTLNPASFGKRSDILALTAYAPKTSLIRSYASKAEAALQSAKLTPHPEAVNETGSTQGIKTEMVNKQNDDDDVDMMAGIRHDMVCRVDFTPIPGHD